MSEWGQGYIELSQKKNLREVSIIQGDLERVKRPIKRWLNKAIFDKKGSS